MAIKKQAIGHTFTNHWASGRRLSGLRMRNYQEAKLSDNNHLWKQGEDYQTYERAIIEKQNYQVMAVS